MRLFLFRNSDEVVNEDSESDDEKGKSHRLRYGSKFEGGSVRSHRLEVSNNCDQIDILSIDFQKNEL